MIGYNNTQILTKNSLINVLVSTVFPISIDHYFLNTMFKGDKPFVVFDGPSLPLALNKILDLFPWTGLSKIISSFNPELSCYLC